MKRKLTAILLTIMMMGTYLLTLGNAVIAVSESLSTQNSKTNNANVEMDSYFTGGTHSQTFEIGKEAKVFFKVKVNNTGYLKNTTIKLINSNYEFVQNQLENENIQSMTANEIKMKQINARNQEVVLEVPIQILKSEEVVSDLFSKVSKVEITGTYIDGDGKEKQIKKEIEQEVKWKAEAEIELAGEVSKYIPYHEEEEYGVIMQARITSNIKENALPVKSTKLEITVPEIKISESAVKPERISVVANSTVGTNGANHGNAFGKDNYYYDAENEVLVIETKNEANEQGKIAWVQGKDEYLITYVFVGKEVYDTVNSKLEANDEINGDINVKAAISVYQAEEKTLEKEGKISYSIKEKIGNIVDFDMTTTSSISKGYIYANYAKDEAKKENKKETTYEQTYYAQTYDTNLNKGIEFQTNSEKLLKENQEINAGKNIVTNKIIIAESIFKKILGTEGKIEVLDTKGASLGAIDADSKKEDESYVLDISEKKVNEVIIKTSAPVVEGRLEIKLQKSFTTTQTYTKEEMQEFSKMTVGVIAKTNTDTKELQKEVNLQEPVSKAELSIGEGKQNLSAVIVNKDVGIRVVLDTSSVENALYKNPVIEIQMPTQVKKVDIKSANLLLDEELKIKDTKVVSQNNRQIIQITLEGTQTDYYGANDVEQENVITKGANIVLSTDITLDPLSPSKTEEIVMYYINENTNLYEETYAPKARARAASTESQAIGMTKTGITIVGQNEVVTASGISNYAKNGEDILSASEGTTVANIEPYTEKKVATVSGKIINNYENKITDVVILGRFPAKDNKKIDTTESLGSTFGATLSKAIELTGINQDNYTVYYSNKVDASKDLTDTNNGWTTTASADSKSYMIVTKNYEMESGTIIDFNYNIDLSQNLTYNQSTYTMYKIYYTNVSDTGTKPESKISHIIGMTTGVGTNIELTLKSATSTVREGQIVRMTVTIKNTGGIKAENAKLLITAPEGTVHTELVKGTTTYKDSSNQEKVINLGDINIGDTITKEYDLKIKKGVTLEEVEAGADEGSEEIKTEIQEVMKYPGDKQLENVVRISADNITNEIKSESYILNILEGHLSITNVAKPHETTVLKKGDKVQYKVRLENISYEKNLENVVLKLTLPTGVKIDNAYYLRDDSSEEKKDNITINGNTISVNVGNLESIVVYDNADDQSSGSGDVNICMGAEIYIEFTIDSFQGEHNCIMTATASNMETHYSNVQRLIAEKVVLTLTQNELSQRYIKEGTEYTYHFIVKNTGDISSISNKLEMTLPEGLSLVKAEYEISGEKDTTTYSDENGYFSVKFYELKPGETLDIAVTVKANLLSDKNDKEVTTVATLSADGVEKITSNSIKAIIEYDEDAHKDTDIVDDSPTKPTETTHYKITGTAWLDENKDGKRDDEEKILSGIQVLLIYKSNSKLVTSTTTNDNGKYEFNNLKPDEYLVVFLYDASKYDITDYQKEGIGENYNSDATNMKIVLDGEQRYAGVTDTIKVTNSNIRDIDIGLYVSEKFDLRLDKYISKITVTTPSSGTKVYNYNNAKLTKREVYGKDVGSSSVIVEYKIVVTNEGQVEGYAKKLVDYLPQDVKFSSELNQDWYLSDNTGSVYNTSLANEKIMPGQSKEVTLILSFNITDKIIGNLINNNAEIYESYNEQGLEDIDSNPANKLESEDDMSSADIMISLATGKIILYITLTITVIILLGFGIFEIKRRVLIKRKD